MYRNLDKKPLRFPSSLFLLIYIGEITASLSVARLMINFKLNFSWCSYEVVLEQNATVTKYSPATSKILKFS